MTRAELVVDTLVLEGIDAHEAEHVGAAIEARLARLARERGVRAGTGATSPRAEVELRRGEPPAELGARLADAIFTAISGRSEP